MEMDLSIWLQLAVVLVCVAVGGRLGGVGLGAAGGLRMDEHRGAMSGAFCRRHVAQRAGTSYGSRTGRSTVGGRRADHAVAF